MGPVQEGVVVLSRGPVGSCEGVVVVLYRELVGPVRRGDCPGGGGPVQGQGEQVVDL